MVEFLIITSCYFGTAQSCEQGAQGYYVYSGLQDTVSNRSTYYVKKYPIASNAIGYMAAATQGQLVINLSHGKSLTLDGKGSTINFKGEF